MDYKSACAVAFKGVVVAQARTRLPARAIVVPRPERSRRDAAYQLPELGFTCHDALSYCAEAMPAARRAGSLSHSKRASDLDSDISSSAPLPDDVVPIKERVSAMMKMALSLLGTLRPVIPFDGGSQKVPGDCDYVSQVSS